MAALPINVDICNVDLWFQDEARIGQQGTITRLWAKTGTRPRAIRQLQYEYAYIFGAVCPERDEAVAIIMPAVNNEAMKKHLEEISKQVPKGRHAVLVLDRAAWHTSAAIINCCDNITILPLPAASPELNPVEQVWQWLRDKFLANRVFSGYYEILEACSNAWNKFCSLPNTIKSLCSRDWAYLGN